MAQQWTEALRTEITDEYIEKMEILGNDGNKSMDIVNEIRESFAIQGKTFTANAIRLMLMKQRRPTESDSEGIVYIKKSTASSPAAGSSSSGGTAKLSKAEAQKQLKDVISAINPELVGEEGDAIIDKMTGKAAQYFTGVVLSLNGE